MGIVDQPRPETTPLSDTERERVAQQIRHRNGTCSGCHGRDFRIGDALYLGFLFRSEEQDAYIVALTCTDLSCPAPYTGITVRASEIWPR